MSIFISALAFLSLHIPQNIKEMIWSRLRVSTSFLPLLPANKKLIIKYILAHTVATFFALVHSIMHSIFYYMPLPASVNSSSITKNSKRISAWYSFIRYEKQSQFDYINGQTRKKWPLNSRVWALNSKKHRKFL